MSAHHTAITRRIRAEIEACRRWSAERAAPPPAHGHAYIGSGPAILEAMFGPRHPAEPVLLTLLQSWTRRRWFQGCAAAFPRTAKASIEAAQREALIIRALIVQLRMIAHAKTTTTPEKTAA